MKKIIFLVLILAAFIVGCQQQVEQEVVGEVKEDLEEKSSSITDAELSMHDRSEDCWVGYKGTAYDVTDFLNEIADGYDLIVPNCGTSEKFFDAVQEKYGNNFDARLSQDAVIIGRLS